MKTFSRPPDPNPVSPELAHLQEHRRREALRLAAHHRRMLAEHWPGQYGKPERSFRRGLKQSVLRFVSDGSGRRIPVEIRHGIHKRRD